MAGKLVYRRLRAPKEDRAIFIEPAGEALDALIASNRQLADQPASTERGEALLSLRAAAREELIAKAVGYTSKYLDTNWVKSRDLSQIFLSGHQPELFHPGVWLKNFTLSEVAKKHNAVPVNLLIDNDECRKASIGVPTIKDATAQVDELAFDAMSEHVPWEERAMIELSTLKGFAEKINGSFGRHLGQAAKVESNLGRCLAQARHRLEAEWTLQTLELPLGRLCDGEAFTQFGNLILDDLPSFRRIYNSALSEYRDVHQVRSVAQPLPDLKSRGIELETPFWAWTEKAPQRLPFASIDWAKWSEQAGKSPARKRPSSLRTWQEAHAHVRIRPRALITTMFARLVLGDLFIHGIGGAKYDQITDLIVERFFGLKPPGFMVVSGTYLLPQPERPEGLRSVGEIEKQLRDCAHHPENHLPPLLREVDLTRAEELIEEKHRLLRRNDIDGKTKHTELVRLNAELNTFAEPARQNLLTELHQAQRQQAIDDLFSSREYAFCLHSPAALRQWLLDSAQKAV